MLVDSHCHIDFPEFADDLEGVFARMREHGISHALCVGVTLEDMPRVLRLAQGAENVFASVGVHPDQRGGEEPTQARLCAFAAEPKVVAIGETGLDYYRTQGDTQWQRDRFRTHIRAARSCRKPLIIHTRDAAVDTMSIMREEGAAEVGGVMHCFTESLRVAEEAMEMNFHISFSGIVTFRNASALREVARRVPLERLLIETDAPYLAPVPVRGQRNEPAFVRYVAQHLADIKNITTKELADVTSSNFFRLFRPGHLNEKDISTYKPT
jgi:TatD DNase family protein